MTGTIRITTVTVTPVAFHDPPLLNSVGVHEPFALRAVIELVTDAGLSGIGESYAGSTHLRWLRAVAAEITGADVHATNELYRRVAAVLAGAAGSGQRGLGGPMTAGRTVDQVFAPFEVACLDV
jgi:glucarate dehydratase